ncbi:MAG: hypothetical protein J6S20_04345 [Paludibacteraceae bacterium]|mgnify:CR=1 FL=1|nr:hypothetical protein [Paludibacteraceae bacterium]MBO7724664.1 hypothetical protein [Paludibacteraceae bacterium]
MPKKKFLKPSNRPQLNRTHRMTFLLNDEEKKAFDRYVRKYRIKNQSRFLRELVMISVIRQLEEDHPTLF